MHFQCPSRSHALKEITQTPTHSNRLFNGVCVAVCLCACACHASNMEKSSYALWKDDQTKIGWYFSCCYFIFYFFYGTRSPFVARDDFVDSHQMNRNEERIDHFRPRWKASESLAFGFRSDPKMSRKFKLTQIRNETFSFARAMCGPGWRYLFSSDQMSK